VPAEALADEARGLCLDGAGELTLVAQDLTSWRDGGKGLADLCRELSGIPGLKWIRLMYLHPQAVTEGLLKALREVPGVVPYLDIPFQHASPKILKAMGRTGPPPIRVVGRVRRCWPEAAIRTTLMTGFPGETEEDFWLLTAFLEEARLEHAGFFRFSPEEGAPAASLPDRPPRAAAARRLKALASIQRRISRELNRARRGSVVEALVEGPSEDAPEVMCGRASFQAPDVDGLVYFDGEQPAAGTIVEAEVLSSTSYDLKVRALRTVWPADAAGEAAGSGGRGRGESPAPRTGGRR
jgi:tRNA-2-methylthio-N6-dimethylallyladenosine synthase/ribosomal protein S12 methylthiotransferase